MIKGVKYVIDDKGEKTAVIIDLEKHREVWESFQDILIARKRADEPRESLYFVKSRLRKKGKLVG